jgi:hypothetical protein
MAMMHATNRTRCVQLKDETANPRAFMSQNITLTISSLLTLVLFSLHLTDDVLHHRGRSWSPQRPHDRACDSDRAARAAICVQ